MKFSRFIAIAALAFAGLSCVPNVGTQDPAGDNTLVIPAEGGSVKLDYVASASWSIINDAEWLKFSKTSGAAGALDVTITAAANGEVALRTADFFLLDGAKNTKYTVSQDCSDVIILSHDSYYVPMEGEFKLTIGANTAIEISSADSWIHCPATKAAEYKEGEYVFTLDKNPSSEPRNGKVTVKGGSAIREVNFIQSGWVDMNWDSEFFKSVLGIDFTGTWCGNCPSMSFAVEKFEAEQPGRLNCIKMFNGSGNSLNFYRENDYMEFFGVDAFPTIVMDNRGYFSNLGANSNYNTISNFVKETLDAYPAASSLTVEAGLSGRSVQVMATVFSKESIDYHVHAVLLESGIVAAQADYAGGLYTNEELKNFVHNHVIKDYITEMNVGAECSMGARSNRVFTFTATIPDTVVNPENLSVLVYTTRPATEGPKKVQYVHYYSKMPEYVDNCVICNVK